MQEKRLELLVSFMFEFYQHHKEQLQQTVNIISIINCISNTTEYIYKGVWGDGKENDIKNWSGTVLQVGLHKDIWEAE